MTRPAEITYFANGSSPMKKLTEYFVALISFAAVTVGSAADPHDAITPCWRGQPTATYQNWDFRTSANPASPEVLANAFGASTATITPGPFSDGYFASIPGSTNVGFWDLGQSGTITASIPNNPSATATSYKYVWVQVAQYIGGVFPNYASVTIANGTLLGGQRVKVENAPPLGAVFVDQTMWRLEPSPSSEVVTITAPSNGSLIDGVIVDTWCVTNSAVWVDDDYGPLGGCVSVGWPYNAPPLDKLTGQTAFAAIQQGIANAPTNGSVFVASGSYSGNVVLNKNLTLSTGPGAAGVTLSGNLSMNGGSTFEVDLNGLAAGSQYDRWTVNGTVNLAGATLDLHDSTSFPVNSTFTIIDNDGTDPIVGTFAGLPEGTVFDGLNQKLRISYVGGSGNDVVISVVDHAPAAVTDYAATSTNTPVNIPIALLLSNDTDPDGDPLSFISASTPFGTNGMVSYDANYVTYTPPLDFTGSNWFSYLIQDSQGVTAAGRVDVFISYEGLPSHIVSVSTTNHGATFTVKFDGIVGRTYSLQRAPDITGPWATIAPVPVLMTGFGIYYDATPPEPLGFYRTVYP
jgi:hypothetical protein